jgi:hypothetical protein
MWEIVQEAYVILATLDSTTQGEVQRYENNYKAIVFPLSCRHVSKKP